MGCIGQYDVGKVKYKRKKGVVRKLHASTSLTGEAIIIIRLKCRCEETSLIFRGKKKVSSDSSASIIGLHRDARLL